MKELFLQQLLNNPNIQGLNNSNRQLNNPNVQGLSTVPFFESLPNNNYHDTRLFENLNAFRNSTASVRGNTNLRKLPTTSTRIGQSKGSTPRTSLNSTSSVSTGRKFKVIANPIPGSPVKSFQKMNYLIF